MTAYIAYFFKFLYRIKWWLVIAPIVVAVAVYLYMGGLSRTYKTTTTIYTGIVSGYNTDENDSRQDWNSVNNAMDNLINIIQSQTTLHNVSLRLYARSMSHGNPDDDNNFIMAHNYRNECAHTPKMILDLIVPNDEEQTYANLRGFETADHNNHVYGLFHWSHRYYSYQALSQIKVRRINNSDMLEISYENSDPGIVYNTLDILNDEFIKQYRELRFGETNNVIAFFEGELARVGGTLNNQEDSLRDYSIENRVINYDEQTKHIAALSRDFELKNEETRLSHNSAEVVRTTIESQLEGLQVFRNNAAFIKQLHQIGNLQSQITSAETFMQSPPTARMITAPNTVDLEQLRHNMARETDTLRQITAAITAQKYTKEGMATSSLIEQWLEAMLLSAKTKAELDVLDTWEKSLDMRYEQYAPVGSTLTRKKRLINFTEQSYLSLLQALNTARLRQKNLQMTSATLKVINPPVLPIAAEPTKRKLTVFASFFATACFVLGIFILLELLDRTLRDKIRAERITGGKVIGAFPGEGKLRQRRFQQQYQQIAARNLGNTLLDYFTPNASQQIINILSTAPADGKTMLAQQLAAYLRETGIKVRTASWNNDFKAEQREYLLATHPREFIRDTPDTIPLAEAEVVIIEYPPLSEYSVPGELLRGAAVNLLCAPANRTWKDTDQLLYDKCVKLALPSPLVICLNYASRDVVELFTGLLPPYTYLRKIGYQISQFGFTAVR